MNKILISSVLFVAIAGCSKHLDYRNTELSNGMFYGKGENKPFTGKITNVPLSILPTREWNEMVQYARDVSEDDSFTRLITATSFASLLGQNSSASAVLCDTHVKDGYLTGEANCAAGGKYKVADIDYTEGTIDGAVTLYSLKDQNENTLATADFVSGKLDGNFKVYGLKTHKVVFDMTWKNGVMEGEAKVYSKDTGKLIAQGNIVATQRDGEWKAYDPDTGKFVKTEVYKNGNVIESQAQTPSSNELASFKAKITSALSTPTPTPQPDQPSSPNVASTPSSQEQFSALNAAITEMVGREIAADGGAEYLDGRKIIEGDFNGDHSSDAVVLYSIEGAGGGNSSVQTLALLFGSQGKYVAQSSTIVEGASSIELGSNGNILVTSLTHGPDDPSCCPSMKTSISYRVEGNQLRRLP